MVGALQQEPLKECDLSIIVAGRSGGGVSTWANIIANQSAFESNVSFQATTTKVGSIVKVIEGKNVTIYDTPALLENSNELSSAGAEIDRLFGSNNYVLLYVFGSGGGRITSDEVSSFLAFQSMYNVDPKRTVFLINNVRYAWIDNEEYKASVTSVLKRSLNWTTEESMPLYFAVNVYFTISTNAAQQISDTRDALLKAIFDLTPVIVNQPITNEEIQDLREAENATEILQDSNRLLADLQVARRRIDELEAELKRKNVELVAQIDEVKAAKAELQTKNTELQSEKHELKRCIASLVYSALKEMLEN